VQEFSPRGAPRKDPLDVLSPRELEVLELMAEGRSTP
jgi:DNA-binding CsgD family transcriptional regulator